MQRKMIKFFSVLLLICTICVVFGMMRPTEVHAASTVTLNGDFNGWSGWTMSKSGDIFTYTGTLSAGTYKFKIIEDGTWMGNDGSMDKNTGGSNVGWEFFSWAGDCTLVASASKYTFIYNASTNYLFVCNNHSMSSKVTTAATCTSTGVKTYSCATCHYSYTETIAKLGHSYSYAKNVNPTTSASGSIKGTCSRCKGTTTVTVPKLTTTDYTRTTTKAATCTATGTYTWTWKTTTYGSFSFNTTIAAKGHNYTAKVTAPTCTAQGYTTHTCGNCGNSYKDTYKDALGHSYTYKVTKNPTTSASGTLVGTCSRCSASTGNITIGKLGTTYHTYKVTKAATCTATGTGRYTWGITDYGTYYWDVSIPATGHSYSSKVTAPTCTAQGYTTHTCSKCSDSYKDTYTAAKGHSWSASTGKCSTCGTACSHSWNSGSVTTQPTCTATGVRTYTCNTCKTTKTESISAIGHSYSGGKCGNCGDTRPVQIAGSFNGWATQNLTYSSSGYTFSVTLSAGTYQFKLIKDGTWLGNNGEIWDTTTATSSVGWEFADWADDCNLVATGGTYNFTFKYDTNMLIITYTHTHAFTAGTVVAPTCTEQGYTTHTCSKCDDRYTDNEIPATGHSYVGDTCTSCGNVREYYLIGWINGMDYGFNDDAANLGIYKFVDGKLVAAFTSDSYVFIKTGDNLSWYQSEGYCTDKTVILYNDNLGLADPNKLFVPGGVELTFTLVVNNDETLVLSYEITKCSHSYNEGQITGNPSCTDKGEMTYTCSICGHTYTEEIDALGHKYESVVTAPTCTEKGWQVRMWEIHSAAHGRNPDSGVRGEV